MNRTKLRTKMVLIEQTYCSVCHQRNARNGLTTLDIHTRIIVVSVEGVLFQFFC